MRESFQNLFLFYTKKHRNQTAKNAKKIVNSPTHLCGERNKKIQFVNNSSELLFNYKLPEENDLIILQYLEVVKPSLECSRRKGILVFAQ